MFTRVVKLPAKPRKARDLTHTVNEKVLSILQKPAGIQRRNYPRLRRGSKSYSRHQFLEVKENADVYQRTIQQSYGHHPQPD